MNSGIKKFFNVTLWHFKIKEQTWLASVFINTLRVFMLSFRLFFKNQCPVKASALTYYTLLSIVPIAALMFGIAKGYGYENILHDKLRANLEGHEEVANRIISFSGAMIENTRGGVVAGFGVILLMWTALKLLNSIESSLNDIWGVKKGRPILRKLSDYLAILLICPFLIVMSGSTLVYLSSTLSGIAHRLPFTETINTVIYFMGSLMPAAIIWLVFTFIYMLMPNTKVYFKSAFLAGFVAGSIYLLVQSTYIITQIFVAKYNGVYGSFAALPLFLIWLQLSWTIVLYGAELSFAIQNVNVYELSPGDIAMSLKQKNIYALRIVRECSQRFEFQQPPLSDEEISSSLEIPVRSTRYVLFELVAAGVLSCVERKKDDTPAYQPALPTELLTPVRVIKMLENKGETADKKTSANFDKVIDSIWDSASSSSLNMPLSKLILPGDKNT